MRMQQKWMHEWLCIRTLRCFTLHLLSLVTSINKKRIPCCAILILLRYCKWAFPLTPHREGWTLSRCTKTLPKFPSTITASFLYSEFNSAMSQFQLCQMRTSFLALYTFKKKQNKTVCVPGHMLLCNWTDLGHYVALALILSGTDEQLWKYVHVQVWGGE